MFKNGDFLWAGVLALVISFILFGNGIGGEFVFDDTIVIVGNPFIGDLSKFFETFTTPYFAYQPRPGLYRPLTIASYSINTSIFGYSSVSFHVVNILLHALTSYLIFVLFYKLRGKIAAYAGFLFFIFLPIHVEAVTSIVGRAEILSLLFTLGALLFSLKRKYILSAGAFFLGLLSKEMAIVFLPIFLFLELFGSSTFKWKLSFHDFKKVLKNFCYFIPALALYAILRYIALGEYFLKNDATVISNPIKFVPVLTGLWTSFKVFYLYFEKIFFPVSLSTDYSFNQIHLVENPFSSPQTLLGITIFALLAVVFFRSGNLLLKSGIFIFLASYFVISNWVFKTGTIMAERLMYTPSLGLAMIVGHLFSYLKPRSDLVLQGPTLERRVGYVLLATILVFYGFIIVDRNKDWLNSVALYESAYAVAPNSVVNQTNRAYLDFISGDYGEAEKRLDEVLRIAPDHVATLNLAGQNYKKLGQYQKAEESWKKAIGLREDYLRAYLSLGILYYENGYFKSAEKVLTDAVNIYPRWSEVLFLSLAKVSLDKPEEAIEVIESNFGNNPFQKQLKFALGWAYFNKGEREKAHSYFNEVKDPQISTDDFIKTFEGSKVILLGEF